MSEQTIWGIHAGKAGAVEDLFVRTVYLPEGPQVV
jgi:hypothetical protein